MLCASCRGGGGAGCSSRTFGGQCRDCPRENMCDNSFGRAACHSKVCMCDPGANWLETQRQMMAVCGAVCACCLDATLMSNNNAGPQLSATPAPAELIHSAPLQCTTSEWRSWWSGAERCGAPASVSSERRKCHVRLLSECVSHLPARERGDKSSARWGCGM